LSLKEILTGDPQVVGFSTLTYNYPLAEQAAIRLKQLHPEIITVIGGYHATCVPQELSRKKTGDCFIFDYVIPQEADNTLANLIHFLNGKIPPEKIIGKIYWKGELWHDNFERFDPNLNPIPLRTNEMMENTRRFGLYYPAPSQQKAVALLVWSRGCLYNCAWCISAKMFPRCPGESTVKFRDVGNIIEEIEFCQHHFGTNFGFAVDLNFYGGDKDRIRELTAELAKLNFKWYAMTRLDTDPEIWEMMKKGGCTEIGVGVESLTSQMKSGAPMDILKWRQLAKDAVKITQNIGLLTKYYYIFGWPGETIEEMAEEREQICQVFSDEIRISWFIPSPGTEIFQEAKANGSLVKDGNDLSLLSTDTPAIIIPGHTVEEMEEIRMDTYRQFYSLERYAPHARAKIAQHPELRQSFVEWNEIVKKTTGRGFC